jgi:hypothetical protein
MFFGNLVPKKPENKGEGISPNTTIPIPVMPFPGAKRFLSGSLGFLFLRRRQNGKLRLAANH